MGAREGGRITIGGMMMIWRMAAEGVGLGVRGRGGGGGALYTNMVIHRPSIYDL